MSFSLLESSKTRNSFDFFFFFFPYCFQICVRWGVLRRIKLGAKVFFVTGLETDAFVSSPEMMSAKPTIPGRGGHSTTMVSHYAIVFGGSTNSDALKDTWALDLNTGSWQEFRTSGQGPTPRYAHSANLLAANLILVFGGFDSHTYFNDLYILDLTTRTWSLVEPMGDACPPPRYAHTTTMVGRQLLVFGGCGADTQALNDLWIFDLETLTWICPALSGVPPEPRSYHTASLIGDKILFFGGKKGKVWHNDLVMLDIPSRSWVPIHLSPPKEGQTLASRAYHTATMVNDNFICVLGGFNGTQMCKEVLIIDLASLKWMVYGKLNLVRCKHTTNIVNNMLLLFGGHDGTSFTNVFAKLETEPICEFISAQTSPAVPPSLQLPTLPDVPIDKENALVYNTEGVHVQPEMLAAHVDAIGRSLVEIMQHMELLDDDLLGGLIDHMDTALAKARSERELRELRSQRKKVKGVTFGEVSVREHKRAVGHGNVTSDGGPALGLDAKYADRLMRRLSSYENLRAAVRVNREDYMKAGYVAPSERGKLLLQCGSSRPSMELNMQEIAELKQARAEAASCPAAVIISEAGLLPANGNLKFK